ncbi:MAG: hypothetical protein PHQ23_04135, partial [Candidatus Wallbacteria bacterium]|nr:hypothetical protein [Candidatus Wallbacteria bacterium]
PVEEHMTEKPAASRKAAARVKAEPEPAVAAKPEAAGPGSKKKTEDFRKPVMPKEPQKAI